MSGLILSTDPKDYMVFVTIPPLHSATASFSSVAQSGATGRGGSGYFSLSGRGHMSTHIPNKQKQGLRG